MSQAFLERNLWIHFTVVCRGSEISYLSFSSFQFCNIFYKRLTIETGTIVRPARVGFPPLVGLVAFFSFYLSQLRAERDLFAVFLPPLPVKGGDSGCPSAIPNYSRLYGISTC